MSLGSMSDLVANKGHGHMNRPRRSHAPSFKAKVALAAIKGDRTLVELAAEFNVHTNQVGQWRLELLERAEEVFTNAARRQAGPDLRALHAKIGEQALQIDVLTNALDHIGRASARR